MTLTESAKQLGHISQIVYTPFNEEARALELELLNVYRTVGLCMKKKNSMENVATWWENDKHLRRFLEEAA